MSTGESTSSTSDANAQSRPPPSDVWYHFPETSAHFPRDDQGDRCVDQAGATVDEICLLNRTGVSCCAADFERLGYKLRDLQDKDARKTKARLLVSVYIRPEDTAEAVRRMVQAVVANVGRVYDLSGNDKHSWRGVFVLFVCSSRSLTDKTRKVLTRCGFFKPQVQRREAWQYSNTWPGFLKRDYKRDTDTDYSVDDNASVGYLWESTTLTHLGPLENDKLVKNPCPCQFLLFDGHEISEEKAREWTRLAFAKVLHVEGILTLPVGWAHPADAVFAASLEILSYDTERQMWELQTACAEEPPLMPAGKEAVLESVRQAFPGVEVKVPRDENGQTLTLERYQG